MVLNSKVYQVTVYSCVTGSQHKKIITVLNSNHILSY